jgi:hypothetical protein
MSPSDCAGLRIEGVGEDVDNMYICMYVCIIYRCIIYICII